MIRIWRRAVPWLVGPAVLVLRGPFVELAPPSHCPGLLELTSIAATRTWPDLTVGRLFTSLHSFFIVVGLALFTQLLLRATRDVMMALAVATAVGLSPLFVNNLAPPWEAATFASSVAVAGFVFERRDRSARSARRTVVAIAVLLVTALVMPVWTAAAAMGAGILTAAALPERLLSFRWLVGAATTAAFVLIALVAFKLSPPDVFANSQSWRAVAACALPRASVRLIPALSSIRWLVGPLGLALAVLGAFGVVERAEVKTSLMTALVTVALLVATSGAEGNVTAALAPFVLGVWSLAAVGLRDALQFSASRSRRWMASAVLLALLPSLQISRVRAQERDDWVRPLGHESLTSRQLTAMLNVADAGGRFVEEDSTVDVLLRTAVAARRRPGRQIRVVPRNAEAVRAASAAGAVYGFPLAQDVLSYRGFAIEPVAAIAFRGRTQERVAGLAQISPGRPCQVAGRAWRGLSGPSSGGRLAIAADSEEAYGPIALYLAEEAPSQPQPDGWPPRAGRGFRFRVFDRSIPSHRESLSEEAGALGLTDHAVLSAPVVVGLLLHRTQRAPLQLAVTGVPYTSGVVSLTREAVESGQLMVCDAPAIQIQRFAAFRD